METLQSIKSRIDSIQNTRQITQSMRLVSTSKVQKSRVRMEANRRFFEETDTLVKMILPTLSGERHMFINGNQSERCAVIAIAGDRGLCGGYNINAGREAADLIATLEAPRIIAVGSKMNDFLRRKYKKSIEHFFTGVSENPFFDDSAQIADTVISWYKNNEIGSVYIVHTAFESVLSQTPVTKKLLPFEQGGNSSHVSAEPLGTAMLDELVPFYMASTVHSALLESSLCEQSSRITSMDGAVKNSDDMIFKLTKRYNQARQSAITQEIIEIVSGANAVR